MSGEAIGPDGQLTSIAKVQRAGGPTKGWRCAGVTKSGETCLGTATACALDSEKVRAYFSGDHIDGCPLKSASSEDLPGDRGHDVQQGARSASWRLRIDDAPGSGPDGRRQPNDAQEGTQTRRSRVNASFAPIERTDLHTLGGFLDAALHDALPATASLPNGPKLPASELVVPAAETTAERFAHGERILWGRVDDVRRSPGLGGTMLLLATDSDTIGILIPKELRGYFPLADDREFIGRHVMTYGHLVGTRPYVKVPSPRGVAFDPPVRVRSVPVEV